ncbi:MAG: single-stranded DNA-binding protein [Anaerolineae bacterium]|nr:single-stranded DNA-binding protein [Anaerolineae bacterium]
MAGYQQCLIIGNVGRDPETRDLPNGDKVTNFSVAVTRKWNDRQTNERREETTWFRVACYRQLADIAMQYVHKGGQVMVAGRISARAYLDNNQQPAVSLDLNADQLQLLGSRDGTDGGGYSGGGAASSSGGSRSSGYSEPDQGSDIPF